MKRIPQHRCTECDTKTIPIWKDIKSNPDTWFWLECDICGSSICSDCCDEGESETICLSCLESNAIRRGNISE